MKSIYNYENYREYLKDYFDDKKKTNNNFSHRYFAKKAGFSSHSYIYFILSGTRNLTETTLTKMINGLELDVKKAQYFENMVHFLQSKDVDNKDRYFKNMNMLRSNSKFYKLTKKHSEYFENWYNPVIRNIVVYADWDQDYKKLGKFVDPSISETKARESVELLIEIGLIVKTKDGYKQNNKYIENSNVPTFIKEKARIDILNKAIESTVKFPVSQRLTSYSTFAMSEKDYDTLIEYIEEFSEKISSFVLNTEKTEKVYEFIIQLFPLSKKFPVKGDIK